MYSKGFGMWKGNKSVVGTVCLLSRYCVDDIELLRIHCMWVVFH